MQYHARHSITPDTTWNTCFNLLTEDDFSEIAVNGPDQWFAKVKGRRVKLDIRLPDVSTYMDSIKRGLVPLVRSPWPYKDNSYIWEGPLRFPIDEGLPTEREVRARCLIIMSPAADSPQIVIAKKSTSLTTVASIAANGSMSTEMYVFLRAAVHAKLNICVSGGTGAGKTTILESLAKHFPADTRVGVAEDSPELDLAQENVTYLRSVPWSPGMNPNDVATLSWVVAQFQRMRTDRIIVGETRGPEFADFLIAANSGMEGSMTTIHANDSRQALGKMSNFVAKASQAPAQSINSDIAAAVDIIIQLRYTEDGRYRTAEICEVTDTIANNESAKITTNVLYEWDQESDRFIKRAQMTDTLRHKMMLKGINIEPLIMSSIGAISSAHSSNDTADEILRAAKIISANEGSHSLESEQARVSTEAQGEAHAPQRRFGLPTSEGPARRL